MQQWQYKTMKLATSGFFNATVDSAALDGLLNQLGKDGWELVLLHQIPAELKRGEFIAVLKRPVPHPEGVSDMRGACPECGYDLRGMNHTGCPECGWNREPPAPGEP